MKNLLLVNNGSSVGSGESPWMAALLLKNQGWRLRCGGILIHKKWILTARHCGAVTHALVAEPDIAINFHGEDQLEDQGKLLRISGHTIPWTGDDGPDIALLKLARPADTAWVFPGKLESPELGSSRKVFVLGWGATSDSPTSQILQKSKGMALSKKEVCQSRHPGLDPSHHLFCAESQENPPSSACELDSGGPLLYEDNKNLVGLAVRQNSLGGCGAPYDVYIAVKSFQKEIEQAIGMAPGTLG